MAEALMTKGFYGIRVLPDDNARGLDGDYDWVVLLPERLFTSRESVAGVLGTEDEPV